ncbi:MAG: flagellar biosynthesis anti-sigma factor FlgM [Planctomycetes bacterium]|nr:flagellar biosynthesis anti-sigma factor FlgM [Planctomycetota bacterium]
MELSDKARFLEKLKRLPDVRPGKVEEMRERTQEPDFDSDERLRLSLYRMMQDMEELGLDPLEDGGE